MDFFKIQPFWVKRNVGKKTTQNVVKHVKSRKRARAHNVKWEKEQTNFAINHQLNTNLVGSVTEKNIHPTEYFEK